MDQREAQQQELLCHTILDQPPHPTPSSLQLEVELENGDKVYITPKSTDSPRGLAIEFCQEHNLDQDMVGILAESIRTSMQHSAQHQRSHEWRTVLDFEPCHSQAPPLRRDKGLKPSTSKSSKCFGLYERGMIRQQAHRQWACKQRQKQQREELKECTHQPSINQLSRSIVSDKSVSQEPKNTHKHSVSQFQIEESLKRHSMKRSDLSPKPQGKSEHNEDLSPSQMRIVKEMRAEETYRPVINSVSRQIVGNATFKDRMLRYQKEARQRKEILRKDKIREKENMHQPKTNAGPKNRNKEGMPIGHFLHHRKKSSTVVPTAPPAVPGVNPYSEALYHKKKSTAFNKIFDLLCGSEEVVGRNKELPELEPPLYSILLPLLEEIEIMGIELDRGDFHQAMNFLFNTLNPTDRHRLLHFDDRAPLVECVPTGHPQMNERSRQIVQEGTRGGMSVVDYCQVKERVRERQLQSRRVEKERREMRECTFQPQVERRPFYY